MIPDGIDLMTAPPNAARTKADIVHLPFAARTAKRLSYTFWPLCLRPRFLSESFLVTINRAPATYKYIPPDYQRMQA